MKVEKLIQFWENCSGGFQQLISRPLRSLLTILGMLIGIAAVLSMIGIGEGTRRNVIANMEEIGGASLILVEGRSMKSGDQYVLGGENQILDSGAVEFIADSSRFIENIAPVASQYKLATYGSENMKPRLFGATPQFLPARNLVIDRGRFLKTADLKMKNQVCVLGHSVKQKLFGEADPLGQCVRVGLQCFTVIGVLQERTLDLSRWMNNLLITPLTIYQSQWQSVPHLKRILIKSKDFDLVNIVRRQVEDALQQKYPNPSQFNVQSQDEILRRVESSTALLRLVFGIIALVALFVGGIGIMNIMLVSVTERTSEIGLRKAIGATNNDILLQFLTESVIMSVLGGVLGILVGVSMGQALSNLIAHRLGESIECIITLKAMVYCLAFSTLVGLFFGIFPALKAARLDPIEALTHE